MSRYLIVTMASWHAQGWRWLASLMPWCAVYAMTVAAALVAVAAVASRSFEPERAHEASAPKLMHRIAALAVH